MCDTENFKRFRQSKCTDPVALRVLAIDRLVVASNENKGKKGAKPEVNSLEKPEVNALNKPPPPGAGKSSSKSPSLPQKEGQPDNDVYAKFAEEGLRRRV